MPRHVAKARNWLPTRRPTSETEQVLMALDDLKGFILTRHWRDTPGGTQLEYWHATDTGPRKAVIMGQPSVAFVEARHRAAVEEHLPALPGLELRELELQTFGGEPVLGVYSVQFRQLGKLAGALAG